MVWILNGGSLGALALGVGRRGAPTTRPRGGMGPPPPAQPHPADARAGHPLHLVWEVLFLRREVTVPRVARSEDWIEQRKG